MSKQATIWLSFLASIFLFIFTISFWFYNNVYSKEQFQEHVVTGLRTEPARNAVSEAIIEEGFKNRPILRNLLMDQVQPALAGALDGPRIQTIITVFTGRVYESLFSNKPQAVAIDLTAIKSFAEKLMAVADAISEEDRGNLRIPDQIVLIGEGEIPSILNYAMFLIWIGPLALILSIGIFAYVFWKTLYRKVALISAGASLAIGSVILLLLGLWYKPVLLSFARTPYGKTIAQEIVNQFYNILTRDFVIILFIGIVLFAIGFFVKMPVSTITGARQRKS